MESDADRREGEDSHGRRREGLDDLRDEIRERHPGSGDGGHGKPEHFESSGRPESQNELEQLRHDLNEKYPESAGRENDRPEESERRFHGDGISDEARRSASRGPADSKNVAEREEPREVNGSEREIPAEGTAPKMGQRPETSTERPPGEALEQLRGETKAAKDGLGDGPALDTASSSSQEKSVEEAPRTIVSNSEVEDRGAKMSTSGIEEEKTVPSHEPGREGKATNTTGETSVKESERIRESQAPRAIEVKTRHGKPEPKGGRELTDLEKITANFENRDNPERKEPAAQRKPEATLTEASRQEKLSRADAIPVNANHHQSKPPEICFDIPRQAIEEKTGMKMEEGKFYHFNGSVVGKYDFDMYRTANRYIRHFVPVEHHHQIQPGKVHDIKITSVKEVPLTKAQADLVSEWRDRGVPWNRIAYRITHMQPEHVEPQIQPVQDSGGDKKKLHQLEKLERVDNIGATFVAVARLHRKDSPSNERRFYFGIRNPEYKQKTGMVVEEGATYRISGEIEGLGRFQKILRSAAFGQHIPIYVPRELNSKVEQGRQYKITIDSVERIPSVRDSWEKLERPSDEWTWKEIASWLDTEGHYNSESRGGFYADIAQKDKKVIQEICGFYEEQGLHPNMVLDKDAGCYHAALHRVDDVATVIKNTEPFIRTENKKEQIQQFKENLSAPRKTLHGGIRKARKILGLE